MSAKSNAKMIVPMLLSAAAGALGTYIFFETSLPEQFLDAIPIAEALNQAEDSVWPPAPPAPQRPDAGPQQRDRDAGPPLPPLPEPRHDLHARHGRAQGLHYIEAVFGEVSFDEPLPVVMVLHGRGGRAQLPGGPFYGLTHPFRVIVPQAPEPLGSGYEWLPVRVGSGLVDRLSASLVSTASHLARFLRALEARQTMEGKPIVTGFSQGGLVTLTTALYHDDVVGTALPLSAWLPPPLEPAYMRADIDYPRIRAMHGNIDEIVPMDPTRELFDRLSEQGFDVELVAFDSVAHETSAAMNDLFHFWLEAAVCRAVEDRDCELAAEQEARRLQGLEPLDAGFDAGLDAGIDAGLVDASLDGSLDSTVDSESPSEGGAARVEGGAPDAGRDARSETAPPPSQGELED